MKSYAEDLFIVRNLKSLIHSTLSLFSGDDDEMMSTVWLDAVASLTSSHAMWWEYAHSK